jgi:hypothetical protein
MHRAAYHFLKALSIPSVTSTKRKLRVDNEQDDDEKDGNNDDQEEDDEDGGDIDISLDIEAAADDVEAMASTTIVDFEPGDILGKLLALVNQVRMSSQGVRDYLIHSCAVHKLKPLQLRLWVRTRWGSMSDCLESTLAIQKALDYFCVTADNNEDLPPLKKKTWSDFHLSAPEWKLVRLVHHCLQVN